MTIIISGPITNPSFHIAESLAHHLHLNLPSFEIRIDPHKSQQEYQNYLDKLFREKGWWNRRAVDETFKKPEGLGVVVYRSSGELIGDADDFAKWVKKSYNVELTLPTSLITEITVEQCLVAGIKA